MNNSFISIYFNIEFGYIVASYTKYLNGGPNRVMDPVIHLEASIDYELIGDSILEGLEKTRTAKRVTPEELKGFNFWQMSGIKGFATFSKKFRLIDVQINDQGYELTERKRDSKGAYCYSKEDLTKKLPISVTAETLGESIKNMFGDNYDNIDCSTNTFTTVHDTLVTYTRPSDDFVDVGDGHTDAYQIFTYEDDDRNYIAFLIDNLYSQCDEMTIKARWEQMYGGLLEFKYHEVNEDVLKIKIQGETENSEINSYLYKDGDTLIEVVTKINISMESHNKIKKELQKVIKSIKIDVK